jgi:hypothetical protein
MVMVKELCNIFVFVYSCDLVQSSAVWLIFRVLCSSIQRLIIPNLFYLSLCSLLLVVVVVQLGGVAHLLWGGKGPALCGSSTGWGLRRDCCLEYQKLCLVVKISVPPEQFIVLLSDATLLAVTMCLPSVLMLEGKDVGLIMIFEGGTVCLLPWFGWLCQCFSLQGFCSSSDACRGICGRSYYIWAFGPARSLAILDVAENWSEKTPSLRGDLSLVWVNQKRFQVVSCC